MNRRPLERARPGDSGRAILEALIGLSLLALAIAGWGRVVVAGARADANVDHRMAAIELASNELEQLRVREWAAVSVDPTGPGSRSRFEGEPVVEDPSGVDAATVVVLDGFDYDLLRIVTDPGSPDWRRLVVEVTWSEGQHSAHVRLDGAALRPGGSSP